MSQQDNPLNTVVGAGAQREPLSLENIEARIAKLFGENGVWTRLDAAKRNIHSIMINYGTLQPPAGDGSFNDEFENGFGPAVRVFNDDAFKSLSLRRKIDLLFGGIDRPSQRTTTHIQKGLAHDGETKMQALGRVVREVAAWAEQSAGQIRPDDYSNLRIALTQYEHALPEFKQFFDELLQSKQHLTAAVR